VSFKGASIDFTIWGTLPCDQGGAVEGLIVLRAPGTRSGDSFSGSYSGGVNAVSIQGTLTPTGNARHPYRMSGTYTFSEHSETVWTTITCSGTGHFTGDECERGCPRFAADAGGPYDVVRAGYVRLDGSKSIGDISTYRWTFRLASEPGGGGGGNPASAEQADDVQGDCSMTRGSQLAPYAGKAKVVRMQVLCPLLAKLTVTDPSGNTATDETKIDIEPRNWKTAIPSYRYVDHLVAGTEKRFGFPYAGRDIIFSQNECSDGRDLDGLCQPCEHTESGQESCQQDWSRVLDFKRVPKQEEKDGKNKKRKKRASS